MVDQVVDTKASQQSQPDDDYRGEGRAEFGSAKGLDGEEKDQDGASDTNNNTVADIWCRDVQTLDRAKNRLRRSEDAIRHDHRDGQDTDDPQQDLQERAPLDDVPDVTIGP